MRRCLTLAATLLFSVPLMAQRPWQQITVPSIREAAANFKTPPREYGAIHWAIWGGDLTRERIVREMDQLVANGIYIINFGPARGINPKYFSPEYFELITFAVGQAKQRGMKVWIADEGSYPSGFAGGLISKEYPQLGMQGIVADTRVSVAAGQTLQIPAPPDTLGAFYMPRAGGEIKVIPLPADGKLKWTAPNQGMWEVVFVRHVYRSSPTRYINREDGTYSKDSLYSLIDYLDPEAVRAYLKTTHEKYKSLFGAEFGTTVLGFFGDEPDYTGFMPWTPRLLEEFRKVKGYDLQPYLPSLFAPKMTEEAWRAKADYWDVWSAMFRDSFFKLQPDWCAANNLEYLMHENHEELMIALNRGEDLIRNEGDFFRCMRYVQVPGIDNLNQIRPGIVADFPKLASSAAHLFGRPKVWTESGGGPGLNGKFTADYQLVRGINYLQIRAVSIGGGDGGTAPQSPPDPQNPMIAWYVNRASYLLAVGRPAAQVALFHPTNSMWLGDEESDQSTVKLTQQLMERQIDFDYIDEQALSSVATLENGGFRNLSGQVYRGVVIPSSTVISQASLDRLRKFAASGGKVVFVGRTPSMVVARTFMKPDGAPDLNFAVIEPSGDITDRVVQALPNPDVALDSSCPPIKYTRRTYSDGDVYFFFNESNEKQSRTATLAGHGQVQTWDAGTGSIHAVTGATAVSDGVRLALVLGPYESKFIVIGPLPSGAADPEPSPAAGR